MGNGQSAADEDQSKSSDLIKPREPSFVKTWSITEIQSLLKKYETLEVVRELKFLFDSDRSINGNLQNDLCQLFYSKHRTDTIIVYKDTFFHVHKIVLITRCKYFRSILVDINKTHVKIGCDILDVNISDFTDLICGYIYYGYTNKNKLLESIDIKKISIENLGLYNTLEDDMQKLFSSKEGADLVISYRNEQKNLSSEYSEVLKSFNGALNVHCYLSIVSSCSPFLKRLLETKYCNQIELAKPLRLEISDRIIIKHLLHIVMECIYFDQLNFNSIFNEKFYESSSTINNFKYVEIAIKVFEIGQFLETPSLIRGCEDIIVNDILASYLNLSTTILNKILEWSSIDSKYVYQQTIQFLREKFIPLGKDFSEIDKTTESGKVQIKNHIFCKF
ncbi:BTB/POZ domain-containing protein 7-like [Hydra vulgaris]|uniref:BTB/POZ domain-containing protein 7-like n=1 Tax=Hydra vulgaris TaxID=6087 RepID=UPI001F5F7D5F|nr:BTB/POZ domain-containing protein 7-like [Hydra vulgaris]